VSDATAELYESLLILRCQAGDRAALGVLVARYSPGVRLFLRNLTDAATADDLLQDTWFDAYRTINRLRDPHAFAAWLYRIARDKAYRSRRRTRSSVVEVNDERAERIAVHEDDDVFTDEDAEQVRAGLARLPAEQREVLVLRFVQGMSYEQIAAVVGRPVGTVRSRIHYAKVALRARLESTHVRKEVRP
jgi:RNA polymerase sigma-70 factor (ECF subfamily)